MQPRFPPPWHAADCSACASRLAPSRRPPALPGPPTCSTRTARGLCIPCTPRHSSVVTSLTSPPRGPGTVWDPINTLVPRHCKFVCPIDHRPSFLVIANSLDPPIPNLPAPVSRHYKFIFPTDIPPFLVIAHSFAPPIPPLRPASLQIRLPHRN